MHRTVAGVRADFATMQYNTAIAKLIVLNNHVTKSGARTPRAVAEAAVLMTAPLAPHIAEELWELLGHNVSLAKGPFPVADEQLPGGRHRRVPGADPRQGAWPGHRRL